MINLSYGKQNIDKKDKHLLYLSINKIINDLEKNNFLNDDEYTKSKINYFFNQGKSKIFMKSYFIQKGIEKNIVDNIFNEYHEENKDWEISSAKIFAKKKRLINNKDDRNKNLSRLARAGFNFEIAKKILEEL